MWATLSLIVFRIGLPAVMLVALPYKLFELDRYFVPKELILHAAALLMVPYLLSRGTRVATGIGDALLACFLGISFVSSIFATNHWLAQRALGVSVSSALLFWAARTLASEGRYRTLIASCAAAAALAAFTALLQAYGLDSNYFSLNRSPGGTFGNRNFVAHIAAIGLPSIVYCVVTARSKEAHWLWVVSAMIVAASLILTRSRAAWLAAGAAMVASLIPLIGSASYWRGLPVVRRSANLGVAMALAGAAAVWMPNALNWRSDSPYLDSARGMMDYGSGSGRGRLAQWRNSVSMATADPLLGVGPGNWPVRYVRFAPPGDRSIGEDGMTANPWPSSDWVAFLSERGAVATLALLGVFVLLGLGALRGWSALAVGDTTASDVVLTKVVLVGTIAATVAASAFDAVLLLAAPAFLAWTTVGAAAGAGVPMLAGDAERSRWWKWAVALTILVAVASVARSGAQVGAISSVGLGGSRAGWLAATSLDPGSYRINLRAAQLSADRGQCGAARTYARRAASLFPHARAPRRILARCGG